jgi:hypothetical protein
MVLASDEQSDLLEIYPDEWSIAHDNLCQWAMDLPSRGLGVKVKL